MDTQEAKHILAEYLEEYRKLPYEKLKKQVNKSETKEVTTLSGTSYQIEIQVLWAEETGGKLRILGTIDDGGWRTFYPLTEEFILTPNGQDTKSKIHTSSQG